MPHLLASLSSVALPAKHLTVVYYSSTSFAPRRNVVTFHKRNIKLFSADGTLVVLSFPCGKLYLVGKGTEVKVVFITSQHIGNNALLLLYLLIAYQFYNAAFHAFNIKSLLVVLIIKLSPVKSFHYFLELLWVESGYCPMQHILKISPQRHGIGVMLVRRHIANSCLWLSAARFMVCHPFQSFLQKVLPLWRTVYKVLS